MTKIPAEKPFGKLAEGVTQTAVYTKQFFPFTIQSALSMFEACEQYGLNLKDQFRLTHDRNDSGKEHHWFSTSTQMDLSVMFDSLE